MEVLWMKQTLIALPSPDDCNEFHNQAVCYVNQLSALYSIPLIESLYDSGYSLSKLQKLKSAFEMLNRYTQHRFSLMLFIVLYQREFNKRPLPLCMLFRSPLLIPLFLSEFIADFDEMLDEFEFEDFDDDTDQEIFNTH